MTLKLVTATDAPAFDLYADAPTPWRVVRSYSEISAIVDANGRSLIFAPAILAGRIAAAVNLVEGGHGKGER